MPAKKALPDDLSFAGLFGSKTERRYFENAGEHKFNFASSEFQLVNAWWLAEASLLVYVRDHSIVKGALNNVGLPTTLPFEAEETGTQGFVSGNDDFVLVVFRGTEVQEMKDIITDIDFILVRSNQGGSAHQGFLKALNAVWEKVEARVKQLKGDTEAKPVFFTGHSLGAALATLAADRYGNARGLYTFGSPRVGDGSFKDDLRVPTYRFVNNNDGVTRLPPRIRYRHVGTLKYIDKDGHIRDKPGFWARLVDRCRGRGDQLFDYLIPQR